MQSGPWPVPTRSRRQRIDDAREQVFLILENAPESQLEDGRYQRILTTLQIEDELCRHYDATQDVAETAVRELLEDGQLFEATYRARSPLQVLDDSPTRYYMDQGVYAARVEDPRIHPADSALSDFGKSELTRLRETIAEIRAPGVPPATDDAAEWRHWRAWERAMPAHIVEIKQLLQGSDEAYIARRLKRESGDWSFEVLDWTDRLLDIARCITSGLWTDEEVANGRIESRTILENLRKAQREIRLMETAAPQPQPEPPFVYGPIEPIDDLFMELWHLFSSERAETRRKNQDRDIPIIEKVSNIILHAKCAIGNVHRTLRGNLFPYDVSRSHRLTGNAKTVDAICQVARELMTQSNLDLFAIHDEPVRVGRESDRCYANLIWEVFQKHRKILLSHTTCYPVTPTCREISTGTSIEHFLSINFQSEDLYNREGIAAVCTELQALLCDLGLEDETIWRRLRNKYRNCDSSGGKSSACGTNQKRIGFVIRSRGSTDREWEIEGHSHGCSIRLPTSAPESRERGMTKDELVTKSNKGDARGILSRMRNKDSD